MFAKFSLPVRRVGKAALGLLLAMPLILSRAEDKASPSDEPAAQEYRLSANDLLDFRVYQEPDMDAVVRISGDGSAAFPLVGNVKIGGKTISEAVAALRAAYLDGYLVNPQVSITVRAYAKKYITILGQVQKPGSYEIQGNEEISLLQAIGMAGGYTRIADAAKITVKRRVKGKETVLDFNAKKMAKGSSDTSFTLLPGDVVTVGETIF
jgi:polysaccharide export outer membrane protein